MTEARSRLALPLGLITLAVYVTLVPLTSRVWLRTGDEPHYLIAAHSITYDGDLDLSNDYDPNIYQNWYTTAGLSTQVRTRADGAQFLVHTYGLPFLIAPAYRLSGAAGVPYFLAALGALLAANVYLLGYQAARDWRASVVGWFVVAFSPPLVWYVFLIYPEMAGALCVTLAVRVLLKEGTRWFDHLILGLSLAALPWLSARFIPVMATLTALAAFQLWRASRFTLRASGLYWPGPMIALAPLSVAGFSLFNAALYSNPAPTASFAGTLVPVTHSWGTLLQLSRGLLGWLLDHQRGLLVISPIYFVALMGVAKWLWRRAWGAFVVAATFGAALFSLSLFGGFWIGVEPAARYLVFVLPLLGAGIAYAWAHRRGPWLAALTVPALAVSLWAGIEVFKDPLLAQTHDLIGEKVPSLVPYLPSLGTTTYLVPSGEGTIASPVGPAKVSVPAGQAGVAFRQDKITDLSFGWYEIKVPMAAIGAAPDDPVARVLIQAGDNTRLLQAILSGRDFPADGKFRTFTFRIHNPVYNQWEQPPGMWVFSTGKALLILGGILILPETFHSLVLPALWLAGLAVVGIAVASQHNSTPTRHLEPGWLAGKPAVIITAAVALAASVWSLQPLPRTYPVKQLRHFVGRIEADDAARSNEALVAGPEAADVAGVLASTRAQFYPPGRYEWRLRLKAGSAAAEAMLAATRIYAARQPVSNAMTIVDAGAVPADGEFHTVTITFDNPIEQALVFELHYEAAAQLSSDEFRVVSAR